MSDNRKYYYLKLKENYFDDDSIVLLESMQDGVLYSNILLKLYLKSLKHGGRLQLDEDIPYTAQMIATITRQQIGTVERALQIFLKLGLVEVLDSGTFYMSNIELLIGQSSTEAERKRAARLQNKSLSAPRTKVGHSSTRDRDRDYRRNPATLCRTASASASGRLRSSARLLRNGSAAWSVSNAERHRACKTVICTTTHFPMITGKTH